MLEFKVIEIIGEGISWGGQKAWIKVKDESGFNVAFWGRPMKQFELEQDIKNIEAIKASKLPFKLQVLSEIDFRADKYERDNYHIKYSIGECTEIEISQGKENA